MAKNETSCIATAASTLVHQLHPQRSDLTKVRALLRQFQGLDYVRTIPNSVSRVSKRFLKSIAGDSVSVLLCSLVHYESTAS